MTAFVAIAVLVVLVVLVAAIVLDGAARRRAQEEDYDAFRREMAREGAAASTGPDQWEAER